MEQHEEAELCANLPEYKIRAIKEYVELSERISKLEKFLEDYAFNKLDYTPSNSFELSASQYESMKSYQATLQCRLMFVLGSEYKEIIQSYINFSKLETINAHFNRPHTVLHSKLTPRHACAKCTQRFQVCMVH